MKILSVIRLSGLLCVGLLSVPIFAGIYRHDVPVDKYRALAMQPQFDCVGRLRNGEANAGSAVMVSDRWALTAAHVFGPNGEAGMTLELGNQSFKVVKVVLHPYHKDPDLKLHTDLALIQIDRKYTGKVATLYEKNDEVGMIGTIVGYGQARGAFTPTPSGSEKLAGQNMLDEVSPQGQAANQLGIDFDSTTDSTANGVGKAAPLELEYVPDGGDSGGGLFIQKNGKWYLAANVARTVHVNARLMKFDQFGFYGSRSYFTRVSPYIPWIKQAQY